MTKCIKRVFPIFFAIVLMCLSLFETSAETIYNYNGFQYTIINNYSVSISGRTDTTGDLVIPNFINDREVAEIGNRAFYDDANITSVDLSKAENVVYIGMYAFKDCTALSGEVVIPKKVNTIQTAAFEDCTNLQVVDFKSVASAIPAQCFNRCSSLSQVTLNSNIETIGNLAFANCTALEYLFIPNSVTSISSSAFKNDTGLTIGCYYGSYAYEYAKQNSIAFKLLDDVKLGDTDLNGVININDATMVQMDDVQLITLNDLEKKAADVNRDGEITIRDATLIQMYLANIITEF